jgi:hypothetical protein
VEADGHGDGGEELEDEERHGQVEAGGRFDESVAARSITDKSESLLNVIIYV